jgi:hypothetical protein
MPKPGPSLPGPAVLAEWKPLLGSICQVLATLGAAAESERTEPDSGAARRLHAGEERG